MSRARDIARIGDLHRHCVLIGAAEIPPRLVFPALRGAARGKIVRPISAAMRQAAFDTLKAYAYRRRQCRIADRIRRHRNIAARPSEDLPDVREGGRLRWIVGAPRRHQHGDLSVPEFAITMGKIAQPVDGARIETAVGPGRRKIR